MCSLPDAKMPKGKRLCAQAKAILLRVYDYFDNLEQCGGGRGALSRTSQATGEQTSYCCMLVGKLTASTFCNNVGYSERTVKRLRSECAVSGMDFSSPAKRYKSSRQQIVVDDFDREAICRRIYQLYDTKVNLTLSELLVRKYVFVILDCKKLIVCILGSATREFAFHWSLNIIAKFAEGDGV